MPNSPLVLNDAPQRPMRVLNAICSTYWAMAEEDVRVIIEIAAREHELDPKAVEALMGRPLENTQYTTVRNDVAIIPVIGPIFRYASLFTKLSGATSLDLLATDFNSALNNPTIKAILFEIDSPGGEAAGISEFADMVYNARGTKPIHAYVSSSGASAAYWIASACDKIVCSTTAQLGSIGVVAAFRKPDPKEKTIEFVSSQSPNKRPNLTTEEGRAKVQRIIDALGDVFVEGVARNRNVSTDTVLDDFGAGGVLVGKHAVRVGLADELGAFESCLSQLAQPSDDDSANNIHILPRRKAAVAEVTSIDSITVNRSDNNGRFNGMSLSDKWAQIRALVQQGEAEDMNDNTPATVVDSTPQPAPAPVAATPASNKVDANDEIARLRAENRRLVLERYNSEAIAFVNAITADGRMFPAERELVIAQFVQASIDDGILGATEGGTSRVDLLKNAVGARPKHQLTAETLAPAMADLLRASQPRNGMTQNDERAPTETELKELLGRTTLGKSVLTAVQNGKAS